MPKPSNTPQPDSRLGSDASFRLLIENIDQYGVALLAPTGRIDTWNRGAERLQGWRGDEIVGRHFSCLYPPEAVQKGLPESELERATAEGRFEETSWRLRKDGSRFLANVAISALRDQKGNLLGFGQFSRDLSEQEQLENRFRDLLEAAPDAMVISNQDGKIVLVNSQAEKMLGYAREEMLGQPVEMLVPPRFRERHPAQRASYRSQPGVRPMGAGLELYALHKDGHEVPVEISLSPLHIAQGLLVTSSMRDVSERRRSEAIIRQQANEILEISTPVMQLWQGVVVAPLIGSLDTQRTQQFMERLLSRIAESKSTVALVDITGVPTIDTQTARHLIDTVSAVRLLGAQVVLTGVRPAIAQTLVHLGIDLTGITTRSSLSGGLKVALEVLQPELANRIPAL